MKKEEKKKTSIIKKITGFIARNMIGFVIGAVVFGTVGVCAATIIASSQVSYSNASTGLSSTTVQGALDELYEMAENHCPKGYVCSKKPYYAFGKPTTSSTTDYTTLGKNVFVSLEGEQLSVCIIRNSKLECFKNNNYETETTHIKEVFGERNCSLHGSFVSCSDDAFGCDVFSFGDVDCSDYQTGAYCNVHSDGNVECYE